MKDNVQYKIIVESLRLVSATAEQQMASMPEFVCVTDEIVMTFMDSMLLVPQVVRAGLLSPKACDALMGLSNYFDNMPNDPELDSIESLNTSIVWENARKIASDILEMIGEENCPPKPDGSMSIDTSS